MPSTDGRGPGAQSQLVGTNSDSFGVGSGDAQQITNWVTRHFTSQTVGGETVYNLTEPASG